MSIGLGFAVLLGLCSFMNADPQSSRTALPDNVIEASDRALHPN
jgi:hypothetical protein